MDYLFMCWIHKKQDDKDLVPLHNFSENNSSMNYIRSIVQVQLTLYAALSQLPFEGL
jgi:hypothetical protein